jgi:hypothetical protein
MATLRDYQQYEIYENVKVIFHNTEATYKKLIELAGTNPQRALTGSLHGETAVKNGGCNAMDDDGDGYQDNCEEDKFPPEILLNGCMEAELSRNGEEIRIKEKSFQTYDAAREYLEGIVTVVDDCAATSNLSVDIVHNEKFGIYEEARFIVTPVHSNGECGDSIGDSLTFLVKVDGSAPRLSCSFVPLSGDVSKPLVDATGTISAIAIGSGASLVNSLLQYSIEVSGSH